MKKYNLSKIMKRAWELVKKSALTISFALKEAWREAKVVKENLVEKLTANLEEMLYGNKYITAGVNRVVTVKEWTKGGAKRAYLSINCYSLNRAFKGSYKCGYVDLIANKYVCSKWDDVNASEKEYIA